MRRYSVSTWRVRPFLTGIGVQQDRLPRRFSLLDLALLGIATHKLSRIVAKDRITGILRAPFVSYVRSSGAGEVEEEPRGRGFQRGIGHLISCPYCMAPWCATALGFGLLFVPRVTRFFAGILASVATSDFLHRAYLLAAPPPRWSIPNPSTFHLTFRLHAPPHCCPIALPVKYFFWLLQTN